MRPNEGLRGNRVVNLQVLYDTLNFSPPAGREGHGGFFLVGLVASLTAG